MGCVNNHYCSCGTNIEIAKDKPYTKTISSNLLSYKVLSNKTNNKFLFSNSSRRESACADNSCRSNSQSIDGVSNLDKKIIENPLPFVKLIPKKILY